MSEWERHKEIGNTFFKNGDYKKAVEAYTEGIKAKPDEALLYSNRSAASLKAREYESALSDAQRAVEVDPLYTKAYSRLHTAYMSLGKFKEGADRMERAVNTLKESGPNAAATHADTIAEMQKNIREARENALKLAKARSLLQNGSPSEAEVTIRPLFVAYPDAPSVVCTYAEAKAPSDADAANRCLQPFFHTHDMDPHFLYVRAFVSYHRGNDGFKNAQIILRQALSADPDNQEAKDLRKKMQRIEAAKENGNNAFKAKSYQEAISSYTEGLLEDPNNKRMNAVLRGNRSAAYLELKDYDKALVDVDFALNNGNETAKMHARRSRINEQLEQWDEAVRDLTRAAELDPQGYQQEASQMKAKAKKGKRKDFYKILGVEKGAGEADIKRAYKRAALQWHPDKWANGSEEEKTIAENKFKELGEALAILGDAKKRNMYDNGMLDNDTEGSGGMGGGGFPGGFHGMGGMGGGMGGMDMNDLLAAMMMGGMGGGMGGMGGGGGRGSRRGGPSFFQFGH